MKLVEDAVRVQGRISTGSSGHLGHPSKSGEIPVTWATRET